uniref:Uncharacterized protein n=1 Tax=Arundo donax TaxID=35708 RepID=A0A0A9E4H5_ARUDO
MNFLNGGSTDLDILGCFPNMERTVSFGLTLKLLGCLSYMSLTSHVNSVTNTISNKLNKS